MIIERYVLLSPRLKFFAYSILGCLVLFNAYYKTYQNQLASLRQQQFNNQINKNKIIQLKQLIKNKSSIDTKYAQLSRQINDPSWELKLNQLALQTHLNMTWQHDNLQQRILILQGSWQDINHFWQNLIQLYLPWQLNSFELNSIDQTDSIQLKLYFLDTAEQSTGKAQQALNPFHGQQAVSMLKNIAPEELHWLGVLKVGDAYQAYALAADHNILSFNRTTVLPQQHWQVVLIDLKHIVFENSKKQQITFYFGKNNS